CDGMVLMWCFFCQAEDGIRDDLVTGVQTCALPIYIRASCPKTPDASTCRGIRSFRARSSNIWTRPRASGSSPTWWRRRRAPTARSEERRVGKEWGSREAHRKDDEKHSEYLRTEENM